MKNHKLNNAVNVILILYLAVWIYYAAFNWDVFAIKLNTNAGFSVIGGYPFVFFFVLGLVALLILKYVIHVSLLQKERGDKDQRHRITILEKDIEILKMKEVLFKMQTSEMSKNSSHLNALHEKLDTLSNQIAHEEDKEQKNEHDDQNAPETTS